MRVIQCNLPNKTERYLINLLGRISGLLLCRYLPPVERTVEIDALVIRARAVLTIEAKYSGASGVLEPISNGPWRINGHTAADLRNLTVQARRQAQVVGPLMRRSVPRIGLVRPFAFVGGNLRLGKMGSIMPVQPCVPGTVADEVERYTPIEDPLTTHEIAKLFAALEVSSWLPTVEDLVREGFPAPATVPSHRPVRASDLKIFGEALLGAEAVDTCQIDYIRNWSQNDRVAIVAAVAVWLWYQENPDSSPFMESTWEFRDFAEFDLGLDDIVAIQQLANLLQFTLCDKEFAMDVDGEKWANEFIDIIWNELEPRVYDLRRNNTHLP